MPPGAEAVDPSARGVKIVRLPRVIPGPVRRLRMLRVLWFCLCAAPVLLLRRRIALIVTQTNPPLIVPTVALVAALRRTPFVIIAQDVYPEVLFASGVTRPNTLVGRALVRLFAWAYRRAKRVVVLGSFMRQRILHKGVSSERIVTISNWATGALRREYGADNPLRLSWGLQHRFVVLYSGNIGVGHEFDTFLAGVKRAAATRDELAVVFIGAGSRLGEVRDLARALGIQDRVMFHDFVPAEELPLSMGIADLALVTLRDGFEGVLVPSKLFGYMARGIPTLYIGPPSDIAEAIEKAGCGVCCGTGQDTAVAQILCRAMESAEQLHCWSENGRSFYNQHLSRELAVRHYLDLTRDAIRRP
jgi:colanic acid biosynthesis glycosyl transferase WcaI